MEYCDVKKNDLCPGPNKCPRAQIRRIIASSSDVTIVGDINNPGSCIQEDPSSEIIRLGPDGKLPRRSRKKPPETLH